MSQKKPSQPQKQPPQSQKYDIGPSTIMDPDTFARWMSFAVSPDILDEKRRALLKKMSDDLARDPAFLKTIERMLADYGDEIYRISPNDADLAKGGFGWAGGAASTEREGGAGPVAIAPAAAAAALAPPAAALAAAHAPGE